MSASHCIHGQYQDTCPVCLPNENIRLRALNAKLLVSLEGIRLECHDWHAPQDRLVSIEAMATEAIALANRRK